MYIVQSIPHLCHCRVRSLRPIFHHPRIAMSTLCLSLPDNTYALCGHCIKHPPVYDRTITHYAFEEPLRTLLHQFKYIKIFI